MGDSTKTGAWANIEEGVSEIRMQVPAVAQAATAFILAGIARFIGVIASVEYYPVAAFNGHAGTAQVETLTVGEAPDADGNLPVTVIAANKPALAGAGKTIQVAILNADDEAGVATKIRAALIADADIGHAVTGFFTITGAGAAIILTANAAAANDATMAASFTAVLGLNATASANTTAGVAPGTVTRRHRLFNRKADATGVGVAADLAHTTTSPAKIKKNITVTSVLADKTVAVGDVLEFESSPVGAGIADPGGLLIIKLDRTPA